MRNQDSTDFPCTGCGECCRHVGAMLENRMLDDTYIGKLLRIFPYGTNEEGHCEMLVDGKCAVYENRPLICNVRRMAEIFHKEDPGEYYIDSAKVCNYLIDKAGLDPEYKIDITQLSRKADDE